MTVNTRDGIGHVFTVDQITIEAEPVTHNVIGPLDNIGQLVDLTRLSGESFKNYKHRILDTYVHRANATYRGLVNGITRELGLLQFDALTVNIKTGSGGYPESPRIVVDSTEIMLYNKWDGALDYEIDKVINTYKVSEAYYLENLISEINSSNYFTATIGVNIDTRTRSSCLIRQSSDKSISSEAVPSATNFKLAHHPVVRNTIFFEETQVFKTLKVNEVDVVGKGDYYINFETGRVVVKTLPSGTGDVRYIARQIPFVLEASPIFAVDFKDQKFRQEIFKNVLLPDGTIVEGIPMAEAVDIINELFSIKGMYWGE